MTTRTPQFLALFDQQHFPLLAAGAQLLCEDLMGCERVSFFAPRNPTKVPEVILQAPLRWHEYGDARWPARAVWIEIDTTSGHHPGSTGLLVSRKPIPPEAQDPFAWVAAHGPLAELSPAERSEDAFRQKTEALRQQQAQPAEDDPANAIPRFAQGYCIYRGDAGIRRVATYTDLLNQEGVPIPKFRMANIAERDLGLCRFALHALFRFNEARRSGMEFSNETQLERFEPAMLSPGEVDQSWARFSPSRVLRPRPAVRAIPNPRNIIQGAVPLETFEAVTEARRVESNFHLLAFARDVRPRTFPHDDVNATMAAFTHRANGGAIYQIPDALVAEFDHTDCDEVRIADIKLPFTHLFLKFTPPERIELAEGAWVDGCYVIRQGDELLLTLTSRREGVDYSRSLSVVCTDPAFSLHLPMPLPTGSAEPTMCIPEAVERGVQKFLTTNAPPADNLSQLVTRPDGTTTMVEDVRVHSRARRIALFRTQEPIFRACLNIVVNAICFIAFRPEDVTEEWDGNPPGWVIEAINDPRDTRSARDRRQDAQRVLATGDFTRIRICGKTLFTPRVEPEGSPGCGLSPRVHWRRGHWRRQRHGVGLALIVLRWIRPTLVKRDNGTLVETRLYDVAADARSANPPE